MWGRPVLRSAPPTPAVSYDGLGLALLQNGIYVLTELNRMIHK